MRDPAACVRACVRLRRQGPKGVPGCGWGFWGLGQVRTQRKPTEGPAFPRMRFGVCARNTSAARLQCRRGQCLLRATRSSPAGDRPCLPLPSLGGWHRHMALPVRASPGSAPSAAHRPSRGSLQRARGRSCLLWAPLVQRPGPSSSCSASTLSGVSSTRGISAFGRLEMRSLRPALASGSELMRVSSPFPHVSAT